MIDVRPSTPSDATDLLRIWCRAVDSTHDFLAAADRAAIEPIVAGYVADAPLLVATDKGLPVAFIGLTGNRIDALFVDPTCHGRGIGRRLADLAERPSAVDVNEQNFGALNFYRRLGFQVVGRSELDDQGRPYPLLHMRRD